MPRSKRLHHSLVIVTLFSAGSGLPIAGATPATGSPAPSYWHFTPAEGYVDDAIAFDRDGKRLALLHTDASTFMRLVIVDVATKRQSAPISLGEATRIPARLVFCEAADRLLLQWSDTGANLKGIDLIDLKSGKRVRSIKGATTVAVVEHQGQPAVIWTKVKRHPSGASTTTVELLRGKDLRPLRRRTLTLKADNTLGRPALELLYWEPGRASFVGTRRGRYDRKRDVRLPSEAVRVDSLTLKELWKHTPQDLVRWSKALQLRQQHRGQFSFVHVDEALTHLSLIGRDNGLTEIRTPVPWGLYEHRSLKQDESYAGAKLWFSLTIDPVNAEAVKRKKADVERMDLYALGASGRALPIGRVLTQKRDFVWKVGQGHFAYLHKLRGFDRGAKTIELFPLGYGVPGAVARP